MNDKPVQINGGEDGSFADDDGDDIVTITLACNSAGTAWLYGTTEVTKVECSSDRLPSTLERYD